MHTKGIAAIPIVQRVTGNITCVSCYRPSKRQQRKEGIFEFLDLWSDCSHHYIDNRGTLWVLSDLLKWPNGKVTLKNTLKNWWSNMILMYLTICMWISCTINWSIVAINIIPTGLTLTCVWNHPFTVCQNHAAKWFFFKFVQKCIFRRCTCRKYNFHKRLC